MRRPRMVYSQGEMRHPIWLGILRNIRRLRRSDSERFDVRNKLPTLRLRQFGPYRHAAPNNAIGQNPEHSARCGTLDSDSTQTRGFFPTERGFAMAFGTVLLEQIFPSRNSIRILLERVTLRASFLRRLFNFAIYRGLCRRSGFVDVLARAHGPRGKRRRNTERCQAGLHLPSQAPFIGPAQRGD